MRRVPDAIGLQFVGASAKKRPPVSLVAVVIAVLAAVSCGMAGPWA